MSNYNKAVNIARSRQVYKGIAIFGLPGSGKSSVARLLSEYLPHSRIIEVGADIIRPLTNIDRLPSDLTDLLPFITESVHQPNLLNSISSTNFRTRARDTFERCMKLFGTAWAASLIELLRTTTYRNQFLIISGIRGYDNARLLYERTYLLAFLKGSRDVFASRLAARDGVSEHDALLEQEKEESLYRTSEIENSANVVVDVSKISVKEAARLIMRGI